MRRQPWPQSVATQFARPLAADEHRARFWVRHVRIGVVQSELAGGVVLAYALRDGAQLALVALALVAIVTNPLLLLVPIHRWCFDRRGSMFFYAWSISTTVLIALGVMSDGGAQSPLTWLLVLTLAFAGLAYPPVGVLVMGAFMIAAYLATLVVAQQPVSHSAVTASVLGLLTVMIAWVSSNQWKMSDHQAALTRRLSALADSDDLTSLLNRRAFAERLASALSSAGPTTPVSLLVLDLDGFKHVNDTRGHAQGDRVLVDVAAALLAVSGPRDAVARLGGDEFALLLPGAEHEQAAEQATEIHTLLAQSRSAHQVTASIGNVTTHHVCAAEELLAQADQAMYATKQGRQGRPSARVTARGRPAADSNWAWGPR